MTRIDELQKKYPSIPREVIIKWEVVANGVADSPELDEVSEWTRPTSYQTYDFDVTLKQMEEKRGKRTDGGRLLRPGNLYMKNGVGARIQVSTRSPYSIRDSGNGVLSLFEGEERIDEDLYFPRPKPREGKEPVTSRGTPIDSLINTPRQCFFVMPVRYCEYFATGEQCKFCNFNPTQEDASSIGIARPITINLEDTLEAYKIRSEEIRILEGRLEMGGFMSSENESRIYFDFVGKIANAASYKPNFVVHTEAMDRKDMQRLKDAGLESITIQLEVWDPALFNEVCPGKAKHAPHEKWLQSCLDAVDVFGVGSVGGKIIAGLSMIPEKGHKTWQEALESHNEGNRWMIKNGIFPVTSNLRLPPGSIYGADQSNRSKLPPSDYYLEMAMAHHHDMNEFGLYDKLNKLMYCALCCVPGIYCGELGMLERSGDIGSWMADVTPSEANWMAHFVESLKSPAAATVGQKFYII
ncbi:MAG: hypothetical protein Q7O66_23265 [Dehalococcoidia bacterium]|nr:hypothetical protein [Dehalococcoidia bacterium]